MATILGAGTILSVLGIGNSLIAPVAGSSLPILLPLSSANQTAWSGPATVLHGEATGVGTVYSVNSGAATAGWLPIVAAAIETRTHAHFVSALLAIPRLQDKLFIESSVFTGIDRWFHVVDVAMQYDAESRGVGFRLGHESRADLHTSGPADKI